MEAVQRGGERLSAREVMKDDIGVEKVTKHPRFGLQKMLEKNRITRYLKGRADALRESARALVQGWKKKEGMQYA
jgi:hypothetical protein